VSETACALLKHASQQMLASVAALAASRIAVIAVARMSTSCARIPPEAIVAPRIPEDERTAEDMTMSRKSAVATRENAFGGAGSAHATLPSTCHRVVWISNFETFTSFGDAPAAMIEQRRAARDRGRVLPKHIALHDRAVELHDDGRNA